MEYNLNGNLLISWRFRVFDTVRPKFNRNSIHTRVACAEEVRAARIKLEYIQQEVPDVPQFPAPADVHVAEVEQRTPEEEVEIEMVRADATDWYSSVKLELSNVGRTAKYIWPEEAGQFLDDVDGWMKTASNGDEIAERLKKWRTSRKLWPRTACRRR